MYICRWNVAIDTSRVMIFEYLSRYLLPKLPNNVVGEYNILKLEKNHYDYIEHLHRLNYTARVAAMVGQAIRFYKLLQLAPHAMTKEIHHIIYYLVCF